MKRFLSILLAALLCFGVAALPAAAEDAAEPEPTTQLQEELAQPAPDDPTEPAVPEQTETPDFSPYAAPDWHNYIQVRQ